MAKWKLKKYNTIGHELQKLKLKNTIHKMEEKYITITIAIVVAPYVASIFFVLNPLVDVHEVWGHKFILLYEGMPQSMDDGLVEN